MRKMIVSLAIGCLLVFAAGCSSHGKPATPVPTTAQNQQTVTTQANTNTAPAPPATSLQQPASLSPTTSQATTNPAPAPQNQALSAFQARADDVCFVGRNTGYLAATLTEDENERFENELWKTGDGGRNWTHVYTGKALSSLQFPSEDVGYAIETGIIDGGATATELVATQDAGATWTPVAFFVAKNQESPGEVDCVNNNVIFVAAAGTTERLYRTVDGGRSWEQVSLPEGNFEGIRVSWLSGAEGYVLATSQMGMGSQPKALYHTTDGGQTWKTQSTTGDFSNPEAIQNGLPMGGYGSGIRFYSGGVGYLGESRGLVFKTTDGGKTFKAVSDYADFNTAPEFLDQQTGYYICGNTLMCTTDGGATWSALWPIPPQQ